LEFLKSLNLKYVICAPDDSECEYAKVIITTEDEAQEFDETRLVTIENDTNNEFAILRLMMKLNGIHQPMNAVLGIDPGMRFGLALIVDGTAIHTKRAAFPNLAVETAINWTRYIKTDFPHCSLLIRIGTGSRLYSTLFLREILRKDDKLVIELVNEQNTTTIGKTDQSSAVLIAGRWGRHLDREPDLSLDPKRGYIGSLKRLMFQFTDGKTSLSTEEAQSIISGEKPLDYFFN
jgi:hypothetical protein